MRKRQRSLYISIHGREASVGGAAVGEGVGTCSEDVSSAFQRFSGPMLPLTPCDQLGHNGHRCLTLCLSPAISGGMSSRVRPPPSPSPRDALTPPTYDTHALHAYSVVSVADEKAPKVVVKVHSRKYRGRAGLWATLFVCVIYRGRAGFLKSGIWALIGWQCLEAKLPATATVYMQMGCISRPYLRYSARHYPLLHLEHILRVGNYCLIAVVRLQKVRRAMVMSWSVHLCFLWRVIARRNN